MLPSGEHDQRLLIQSAKAFPFAAFNYNNNSSLFFCSYTDADAKKFSFDSFPHEIKSSSFSKWAIMN